MRPSWLVKLNGTTASATVNSTIKITATVPAGATTGPISATTSAGTGTSSTSFTVTGALKAPEPGAVSYRRPLKARVPEPVTQLAALRPDRVFSPMLGMELASDATPRFNLFESGHVSTSTDEALDGFDGGGSASAGARQATRTPLTPMTSRRYSFYSPELNLIAETELTTSTSPLVLHEYVWFNGQPVAQVDAGVTVSWTFTDHLGTPLVQTSSLQGVVWQAEYEPYGKVYALRAGAGQHQPLRLPGQEAEQLELGANGLTERSYNVYRWYRPGWGRYTEADPVGLSAGSNLYAYAGNRPTVFWDPNGLNKVTNGSCRPIYVKAEKPDNTLIIVMPGSTAEADGFYNLTPDSCVGFCDRGGTATPEAYKINDSTDVTITGGCNGCLSFEHSGPISWLADKLDPTTGWQGKDFFDEHPDWPKPPTPPSPCRCLLNF